MRGLFAFIPLKNYTMKKIISLLTVLVVALLFSGCTYNFIVPEEVNAPTDPNDPNAPQISFATEITPVFSNKCASCHKTGSQSPDLSTGNAYTSINNANFVNIGTPEDSKIYTHAHPDTDSHSQKKYTANEAALVLGWIVQGAKNN